ncbi:MAG: DUF3526 domain-containing protein [Hyphomonadaceae bacterium]|nr:DUF3526 domain-containing protein [Hyphomonadaceae bacterium]MBC6412715.1 DUF3526 domain-containing protein [Hyphomonadaceae bacterium]
MNSMWLIAREEWRYWVRSRLARVSVLIFVGLIIASSLFSTLQTLDARHQRLHQQEVAEQTFLSQPARHPHRMVHYGHYAFRPPPPLAVFDPGIDVVTGQSIFLEGHRQNTAMFADARAQAKAGGFGILTPAMVYQILFPLLLIIIGHDIVAREREARTLAPLMGQGVTGITLYCGKALALLGLVGVLALPVLLVSVMSVLLGESIPAGLFLTLTYALFLTCWSALLLLVSFAFKTRGIILAVLMLFWLFGTLIIPRIAVATGDASFPTEGKILTDLRMKDDLREIGDGHNDADPTFSKLKAELLAQYNVGNVEDLPMNFRGVVASTAEARLTKTLNDYAEKRMERESRQSRIIRDFGALSPFLAVGHASKSIAGTDLKSHHRFLREAEVLRFGYVQALNEVHAGQIAYSDDINRSSDQGAEKRTRVDPENWRVLKQFRFETSGTNARLARAAPSLSFLTIWTLGLLGVGVLLARGASP